MDAPRPLLIGVSPRLLRDPPPDLGFRGKTLQYLEQSVATMVASPGAVPVMIPSVLRDAPGEHGAVDAYARRLDALVLQGGADIDPVCYGGRAQDGHSTDLVRDRFELALLRAFVAAGKPVLGICRGMQLINVLQGGTLHHDLLDAGVATTPHVLPDDAEAHRHALRIEPGTWLHRLFDGREAAAVNSIHHQGIDRLGANLRVQAWAGDGVVEAIRLEGDGFVVGLQWHPEFHRADDPALLPSAPIVAAFLAHAARGA
jgi:gamma-glutamyl-gamma-aminobutyrate hydrolase PuuD